MKGMIAIVALFAVGGVAAGANWQVDYAAALRLSKQSQKPVLVYFTDNQAELVKTSIFDTKAELLDAYVTVLANRNTSAGRELYQLFGIGSNKALVIVEKSHQWQWARLQREVQADELSRILKQAKNAEGRPADEILLMSYSTGASLTVTSSSPTASTGVICRT